jgi:hypothetical protein
MDNCVLKSDLTELKNTIAQDTKVIVSEAVDPVKTDLFDLKTRVKLLENRPTQVCKELKDLKASLNKLDPSLKRAACVGMPENLNASDRIKELETFMASHFSGYRNVRAGNYMKGPHDDRKVSNTSYIEFPTVIDKDKFIKDFATSARQCSINGSSISIKPARTEFMNKRNFAVRKAEELIKSSPSAQGQTVKIEWMQHPRLVTVNGVSAFTQACTAVRRVPASVQ